MNNAAKQARDRGLKLRVMFYDEARFGRCCQPKRCWAPPGIRPVVAKQLIREYTYIYGAVSPLDGVADFLILPCMTAFATNLFLTEVKARHPHEFLLVIGDRAPSHHESALVVPKHLIIEKLPAYCPQLNPVENIWEDMREKFFPNLLINSMTAVEDRLISAALHYENDTETVRSITGFHWIVCEILNAT